MCCVPCVRVRVTAAFAETAGCGIVVQLFVTFFKTLVGKEVTVELKNDLRLVLAPKPGWVRAAAPRRHCWCRDGVSNAGTAQNCNTHRRNGCAHGVRNA